MGEIQNNGLAMDVAVFNDKGSMIKNRKGELVYKSPFPSMPLNFGMIKMILNIKKRILINLKIYGIMVTMRKEKIQVDAWRWRSDATLNPGGVRLGTSEIYSVVENFQQVKESIVIGQPWDNDVRIILFVVLKKGQNLSEKLINKLKKEIRYQASPRHVPSKIIKVSDIPRTKNGKIVELAVKNIIEGIKIKNIEAISNPDVLNEYKNIPDLKN